MPPVAGNSRDGHRDHPFCRKEGFMAQSKITVTLSVRLPWWLPAMIVLGKIVDFIYPIDADRWARFAIKHTAILVDGKPIKSRRPG
jgi:hypothetical protein